MNPQSRSYNILALALAIGGGLAAVTIGLLFLLHPSSLGELGVKEIVAALGLAAAVYYGTAHQLLKQKFLGASTLALTLLSAANLILIIAATGGLDSPFYSFWLLVIVASGIFGTINTVVAVAATSSFFVVAAFRHDFAANYWQQHLGILAATLVAGALAEWVYQRGGRTNYAPSPKARVAQLSGQLSTEQLKAQAIMSSMADGVVVVDTNLNVQLFNKAAQLLTGWDESSAQNINYRTVMSLMVTGDKPVDDQNDPFRLCWSQNQPIVKNDLILQTRAGRRVALSMSISPIVDAVGNISGGIAVFRDISQEKEAERQRSEFISTASHEMRTPVAAIEGYIALAMNPKVATIDDRAMMYLGKAHDNTQHLGELFKDLLAVTKLEEGKVGAKLVPVNLSELVEAAARDMQLAASKKGLTLTINPGQGTGTKAILPIFAVLGEPERLREVTMNLIENAIKYTATGGITVGINGSDNDVTVAVSDSGPGIAQEDIQHLFQKFYRVDSSATRTVGGTGLGLYLVRSLVELYGGRVWVESTVGQGSTFFYKLPRIDSAQLTAAPAPIAAPTAPVPAASAPLAPTVPAPTTGPAAGAAPNSPVTVGSVILPTPPVAPVAAVTPPTPIAPAP